MVRALELQGHAIAVRIAAAHEQFPDFYVKCDVQEHAVELTKALEPGRLRGDEYQKFAKESTYCALTMLLAGSRAKRLSRTIRRKVSKRYSEPTPLDVYRLHREGIDLKNCRSSCGDACARFASVWVLMAIWVAKFFYTDHFTEAPMTPLPFEP